jgi:SAM-dependent methyltransferase
MDRDRFFTMAEAYDAAAPSLVPCYHFLQDEAMRLLPYPQESRFAIADLGAGSGILLEKLLTHYPKAIGYHVDYSEAFQQVAATRLKRFGHRIVYVRAALQESWANGISEPLDAIFSMSAIHHLDTAGKKAVYQDIYRRLKPKGWFLNIDEMKSVSEKAYYNSLCFWARHADQMDLPADPGQAGCFQTALRHFENWKLRNLTNYGHPKQAGDDLHENFSDQVQWLEEAGFKNADCFVKYHLWCIIGGQK